MKLFILIITEIEPGVTRTLYVRRDCTFCDGKLIFRKVYPYEIIKKIFKDIYFFNAMPSQVTGDHVSPQIHFYSLSVNFYTFFFGGGDSGVVFR